MSTHASAQLAIETRFSTLWPDQDVDTRFENEARKTPTGKYIQLHVRNLREEEVGFAAGKILYRRPGFIVAQCFQKAHEGTQEARVMADAVLAIFEGQSFNGITCNTAEVVELGDDGEGFWQVNAKIFFDHDFERSY